MEGGIGPRRSPAGPFVPPYDVEVGTPLNEAPKQLGTYTRCTPCHRRNVHCDMPYVGESHGPTCLRCRREGRDCFFSEVRRDRFSTFEKHPRDYAQQVGADEDDTTRIPGGSTGYINPSRMLEAQEEIKTSDPFEPPLQASDFEFFREAPVHVGPSSTVEAVEADDRINVLARDQKSGFYDLTFTVPSYPWGLPPSLEHNGIAPKQPTGQPPLLEPLADTGYFPGRPSSSETWQYVKPSSGNRGTFSEQRTRQMSPSLFSSASLAGTESHVNYTHFPLSKPYYNMPNMPDMPPTMDVPLYHPQMQPLQAYAANGITNPPIKQKLCREDEINPFSMSFQEYLRERTATGTTGVEDHVDSITTADSGYQSGPRTSCTNAGEGGVPDDDADSVVTDGWPSSLPKQDKYLLEAEFAREMFNRSSAQTREQFAERGEKVKDLLYSFSVMIGGRASSIAERGAASFVRRGRKRILKHAREELVSDNKKEERFNVDEMSVTEKMTRWDIDPATEQGPPVDDRDDEGYTIVEDHRCQNNNEEDTIDEADHCENKNEEDNTDEEEHCQNNNEHHGGGSDGGDSENDEENEGTNDDGVPRSTLLAGYTDLRAFLLESEEYRWLLNHLERMDDYGNGDDVHRRVIRALAARPSRVGTKSSMSLCLPWQPREFMHEQYGDSETVTRLGDVITISGSTDNAFASTCEAYILQTWPKHGPFILESVERAINSEQKTLQEVTDTLSLRFSIYADCITIDTAGDPLFLAETAEIMVWLSTACRASAAHDEIQVGRMDLQQVKDYRNDVSFVGELTLEDVTASGEKGVSHATCWHGMFRNPVLAHGYPIPSRMSQEQGLELSIDLMLTLAQAFYGVVYCGVLMLKGFSTLLAPTKKENGSVTWHFIFDNTGARQSYNDGLQHSRLHTLDDAIFDGARHFVGWSASAEFLTGGPFAEYDKIGFSGSKQTNPGLSAEAAFTLTAGKFVGVNAKFHLGGKDKPEWLRTEDYVKNVEEAARYKVILSDSDTKQHWLADGCSVVLHLVRAWLSGKYTRNAPEGIVSKIQSAKAAAGPQRSYETLTSGQNREIQLYIGKHTHKESVSTEGSQSASEKSTSEHAYFLLEDQAQYYYHWLYQIRDRMVLARHAPEISLIRQGNNVIGFEFIDLLRESTVEPCTMELGNGARAWHEYAKDWDAIHIIGSGFGELLRPITEQGVGRSGCGRDLAAPRDRDYLMAPLCVLKEGIDRFRHTRDCAQLSRGLYWSDTERCFGDCQCRNSRPLRKCQSHINNLSSTFTKKPQHNPSMRLPDVFHDRAAGAIIIGTHLVARLLSTAGQKRALPVDNTLGHHSERSSPRRLPSDSGYVTNTDSNASQERQVVDPTAGTPMPARGFQILGAANGNKLQKRRK